MIPKNPLMTVALMAFIPWMVLALQHAKGGDAVGTVWAILLASGILIVSALICDYEQ